MKNLHSLPHHGPHLVCTSDEAALVHSVFEQLDRDDEPEIVGLLAKCRAVLDADPRWKQPLK